MPNIQPHCLSKRYWQKGPHRLLIFFLSKFSKWSFRYSKRRRLNEKTFRQLHDFRYMRWITIHSMHKMCGIQKWHTEMAYRNGIQKWHTRCITPSHSSTSLSLKRVSSAAKSHLAKVCLPNNLAYRLPAIISLRRRVSFRVSQNYEL